MDKIKQYFNELFESVPFWKIIAGIFVIEILSFGGYAFPVLNTIFFIAVVLAALYVSARNLHHGILLLLIDLVINSKGYLFFLSIGNFDLSIRLALFLVIFAAYAITVIRDKRIAFFHWTLWKPYVALVAVLVMGVLVGALRGNALSTIFFDANGYLYFGLVLPFTQAFQTRKHIRQYIGTLFASGTAVIIETVLLLFLFSHLSIADDTYIAIYRWIRETGVGEVTSMPNGFVRIFYQSHIYTVFMFLLSGVWFAYFAESIRSKWREHGVWNSYVLFAFALLTVFLVYSRSFWVGSVVTMIIAFAWMTFVDHIGIKRVFAAGVGLVLTCAVMYAVALGIINFPIPGGSGVDAGSLISERTSNTTEQAAGSSRVNLLRPLWDASLQHPVLGSGLGTEVTYISADPRVLEEDPSGEYTTYAFEWGYLDLWLKFGLAGGFVYAYVILKLFYYGFHFLRQHKDSPQRVEVIGMLLTLLALLGTHFFTPYLNHPLGIGWIIFVSIYMTRAIDVVPEAEKTVVDEGKVVESARA